MRKERGIRESKKLCFRIGSKMESIRIKKSELFLLRKISRRNRGIMMTETGTATEEIIETAKGGIEEDTETEATEEKEAKKGREEETEVTEEREEKEGIEGEMAKEGEEEIEIETTMLTINTKKEENAQEEIEIEKVEKRKNMLTKKPAKRPIIKKSTKRKLCKIKTVNFSLFRAVHKEIS